MKVLLTTPITGFSTKTPMPPLSLMYLAGSIEHEGYDVLILDNHLKGLDPKNYLKQVENFNPDVVGITCNVEDRFGAFYTSKIIKNNLPNIQIVMGGPFPSVCSHQIIQDISSVDIVIRGEGESTFIELLDCLRKGKSLDIIKGITYKDNRGIKYTDNRPLIKDLNELPFPAFHLVDPKEYPSYLEGYAEKFIGDYDANEIRYTASLIFGRGCPFNCFFCSSKELWQRSYRILNPESAVDQISYFVDKGVRGFAFWDDHLLLSKKWFASFANEIKKENLDISFKCLSRVDSINDKIAEELEKIGCKMITLGIESGSIEMLKRMRKQITPEMSEMAVAKVYKNKILPTAGIIMNMPGERKEDITLTLEFFKRLEDNYSLIAGTPRPVYIYPGTDLEKMAMKENKLENFRWTTDYFNKYNLIVGSSPYTPIYENMPLPELMRYVIKESLRLGYFNMLKSLIMMLNYSLRTDCLAFPDKIKGIKILLGLLDCIEEADYKHKLFYIQSLLNEIVRYTHRKTD